MTLTHAGFTHEPVLADEVVRFVPATARTFADCTLGGGGHAERLLKERAIEKYVGFDRDVQAIKAAQERLHPFASKLTVRQARFSSLPSELARLGLPRIDGVLADIGVSSPQLDQNERGFSFVRKGPLDMRMGEGETLADKLATVDEETLANVIYQFGEERMSRRVARAIVRDRATIVDTLTLANSIRSALPKGKGGIDPATRTFQALRIWVNDELDELKALLAALPNILSDGGVALIISFHSLEDRAVKQSFAEAARDCICPPRLPLCVCGHKAVLELVTHKPIVASEEEIERNPRARSAKLRVARRVARAA